jgi:hypothetical protein
LLKENFAVNVDLAGKVYLLFLARGKVYAVDIDSNML